MRIVQGAAEPNSNVPEGEEREQGFENLYEK